MAAVPVLDNRAARQVFLHRHLLGQVPSGSGRGDDLYSVIHALGFVQVDSVNTVERAHHMILFARRPSYRPKFLTQLLERDRRLFEHWTHDAAVIPTRFYDHWRMRFARDGERLRGRWKDWQGDAYLAELEKVLTHVRQHGEVRSSELITDETKGQSGGWWNWHPSKTALEFLWRTGELSVSRRQGFQKVYDLTDRVHKDVATRPAPQTEESIDWLNNAALDRLGFATSGQIAAFWAHVSAAESSAWCKDMLAQGNLITLDLECADGALRRILARPDIFADAAKLGPPPKRIRILSPFDPAIRDRNRTEQLFGFHYRIEIFVPEAKRQYGYYVFPMLEGDRLIGRIDMKADRNADTLRITRVWLEEGVRMTKQRAGLLDAELGRMARFAGLAEVTFQDDWLTTK